MNIDDLKREADIELTDVTATDIRKVIDYLASRGYLPSVQRIDGLDEAIKEFIETVKDCVEEIHYPHKEVLKAARAYAKLQDGEAIARAEQKGGE